MMDRKMVGFVLVALVAIAQMAHAVANTWDADTGTAAAQDGSGTWTTGVSENNWWDGAANAVWSSATPDDAIIGAGSGAAGTITLGEDITVGNLRFNAPGSGAYVVEGGGYNLNFGIDDPVFWVATGVTATNRADSVSDTRDLDITGGGMIVLAGTNSFDSVDIADASTAFNGIAGVAGTTVTIPSGALLTTDGDTPGAFGAGVRLRDGATLNVDGTLISTSKMGGYASEHQYTININPGAVVTNMGNVLLGWNALGTLNINGGIMTVLGSIYHSDGTDGSAINLNGGTLEAKRIVTESGNGTFLVNFNGGTLRAISNTLLEDNQKKSYMPVLQVQNGGAVIDSNSSNIEASQAFLKSGSGGLTKQGSGTLTFSGGTFTGQTTVNAGTLNLSFNKRAAGAANGAVSNFYDRTSRLVLNGGNLTVTGRSAAAGRTRSFTVGTTSYTLCARDNDARDLVAGMTVSGTSIPAGTYITCIRSPDKFMMNNASTDATGGGKPLTFGAVSDTTSQTIDNIELQQSATISVDPGTGPGTTLLVGDITGSGSLTKAGAGTLTLAGANAYEGVTVVQGGTVRLARNNDLTVINNSFETHGTLGSGGGTYGFMPSGATWSFGGNAGIALPGSPFISSSAVIHGTCACFIQRNSYISTTIVVPVAGQCNFSFMAGKRPGYTASGINVEIDGAAKIMLAASVFSDAGATYTGSAVLSSGAHTLTFRGTYVVSTDTATWIDRVVITSFEGGASTGRLPEGTAVTVSAGAVLNLGGFSQVVAGLEGGGLVTNGTLTVNGTVAPGGAAMIGTLTLAATSTLNGTLRIDLATDGTCDRLTVPGNLTLSGLTLKIENPSQFRNGFTYVIATCAAGGLNGPFAATDLGPSDGIHVTYDNVAGEVRLEVKRGTVITLR